MFILEVAPISRGAPKDTLSYFSAEEAVAGSIVEVPLRGKNTLSLVVRCFPAEEEKSEIKSMSFPLKKAGKIKCQNFFLPQFIESVRETAKYHAASFGAVLSHLVPDIVLQNISKFKNPKEFAIKRTRAGEIFVLQAEDEERFANYKSLIREEFAKQASIFFCLPTIEDTRRAFEHLGKGVEKYAYMLHSERSPKEIIADWNSIVSEKHPVAVLATGSFLSIPRSDFHTIVIERENSRGFKSVARPFVDARFFAEEFAKKTSSRLIYGDMLLRTETVWRHREESLVELAPLKFRFLTTAATHFVDMRQKQQEEERKEFTVISEELKSLARDTKEQSEQMFVLNGRRGLYPSTVCGDCGASVLCLVCKTPMVLHHFVLSGKKKNVFLCHKCGEKRSADEKCSFCESWNLTTLGIGIERVISEFAHSFPEIPAFRLDADTAKTHKKASEIVRQFLATPGSVLFGTEKALVYLLDKKVANTAVVSLDSLFSIPDFRINERALGIIVRVRKLASKNFLMQTRMEDKRILEYGLSGNLADFYREEIKEREKFGYPPFSVIIKITLAGKDKIKVKSEIEKLLKLLEDWQSAGFPAWNENARGFYTMNIIIKLGRNEWPDEKLRLILTSLPQQFAVAVEPETLL
ncbi:MAG: hypothetical protein Q8P52_00925 [bacterium]|nr:hypothetical protein [bacterium]